MVATAIAASSESIPLNGDDLLAVAAVSVLMVSTVKVLEWRVSRARRRVMAVRAPFAPTRPPTAPATASAAMTMAAASKDEAASSTAPGVLRVQRAETSGTDAREAIFGAAGSDTTPADPQDHTERLRHRRSNLGRAVARDNQRSRPMTSPAGAPPERRA
jgi:hypothetical protein